jgi:hypothetical protein
MEQLANCRKIESAGLIGITARLVLPQAFHNLDFGERKGAMSTIVDGIVKAEAKYSDLSFPLTSSGADLTGIPQYF